MTRSSALASCLVVKVVNSLLLKLPGRTRTKTPVVFVISSHASILAGGPHGPEVIVHVRVEIEPAHLLGLIAYQPASPLFWGVDEVRPPARTVHFVQDIDGLGILTQALSVKIPTQPEVLLLCWVQVTLSRGVATMMLDGTEGS